MIQVFYYQNPFITFCSLKLEKSERKSTQFSWKFLDNVLFSDSYGPPTHVHASVGRLARTYLHQLCTDTGCTLERWMIGTYICLCLRPHRTWHKVTWPKGRIIVGFKGGEGRIPAEVRALLVYAGHRLTWCNMSWWA